MSLNTQDLEKDTISFVVKDDVEKKDSLYLITSLGDTLSKLGEVYPIGLNRVYRESVSLTAVGDIMMGTNFPNASYLPPGNGETLWSQVSTDLTSTDLTFGNLEGVILSEGGEQKECKNPKACYLFRTPDPLSYHFQKHGFDMLSLANNHANDFGETGRANTQNVLDSLGIYYAGSTETPYQIVRKKGLKVGFIAFAPNKGTLSLHDEETAIKMIKHLDSITDWVLVSFHAGAEGSKNQRINREREFYYGEDRGNVYEFARICIEAGADVIIGHGPHVPRAIDIYKNKFIAYSLGNFLTYGRFNLKGANSYAPLLVLNLDSNGSFIDGKINSYLQSYSFGPMKDDKQLAAKQIKWLTEIDFPESKISIDDSGRIFYLQP